MENRRQKPLSTLLLTLFSLQLLLPLILSLCAIFIKHWQHDLLKEHQADQGFFTRIPVRDIPGFNHGEKEFVYKGTWYDAERVINENGEEFVLAVPDKKETHIAKLRTRHFEKSHKKSSAASPFFTFLFYEKPEHWHYAVTIPPKTYNHYTVSRAIAYVNNSSPPPWA